MQISRSVKLNIVMGGEKEKKNVMGNPYSSYLKEVQSEIMGTSLIIHHAILNKRLIFI